MEHALPTPGDPETLVLRALEDWRMSGLEMEDRSWHIDCERTKITVELNYYCYVSAHPGFTPGNAKCWSMGEGESLAEAAAIAIGKFKLDKTSDYLEYEINRRPRD